MTEQLKEEKLKKVNIKHIAKIANLSTSTVSRALRNDPEASKETIEKVKLIAEKLNYYPNAMAKSLRGDKSYTIGIVFNDMNNPFYSDVLRSIFEKLNKLNYSIIVTYYNWDFEQERKNIINLISKRVDGIIYSPIISQLNQQTDNISLLMENGIETVYLDNYPDKLNVCYSGGDHKKAIYLATKHLLDNGHRDILLYSAMPDTLYAKQCEDGYIGAFSEKKFEINKELFVTLDNFDFQNSYIYFKKFITNNFKNKKLKFTGIVATGDILAISIYKVANELGLSIPDDFSIVSYDNIEIVSALNPPLTTIHQPRKEIGENAVRILLHNINNKKNRKIEKSIMSPYLVNRKSVKNLKQI